MQVQQVHKALLVVLVLKAQQVVDLQVLQVLMALLAYKVLEDFKEHLDLKGILVLLEQAV